jgi:hypothetical protein
VPWDDEPLVVGWDRDTKREVYVDETDVDYWRTKGYKRGDGSLVCLYCFEGDEAPPGTIIPLVVRHRVGGRVRAHFAHPPGLAPPRGHHRETVWHSTSKHLLAAWARGQDGVVDAFPERSTPDADRRSDVRVIFRDGSVVALELQHSVLHDEDWRHRHADYVRQDIVDVWIWEETVPTPWMVAQAGLPIWFLDLKKRSIGTLVGKPHRRLVDWFRSSDMSVYAEHHPPCVSDETEYHTWPMSGLKLTRRGLELPSPFAEAISAVQRAVLDDADDTRMRADLRGVQPAAPTQGPERQTPSTSFSGTAVSDRRGMAVPLAAPLTRTPAQKVATPAKPSVAGVRDIRSRPAPRYCDLCDERLDEFTYYDTTRHITCEQDRRRGRWIG